MATKKKAQSPVQWRDRYVETITVKAGSISPHLGNPKLHGEAQKAALTGLLEEVGKVDSLKAYRNKKGDLVYWDGHARMSLNPEETWRVDVFNLTEAEVSALLLSFDPIGWMAEQSKAKVEELMAGIQAKNAELNEFLEKQSQSLGIVAGNGSGEMADAEVEINKAEELNKRWKVRPGDLWLIGDHRLLCGDSTKPEDVARVMNGEKAVQMNTDPPYGVDYVAVKNGIPVSGMQNIHEKYGDIENDELTDGAKLQEFLEAAIRSAVPHLVKNAAFYLWHPMLTQGTFFAAAAAADILIHRQIIWVKPSLVLTRSGMYHWRHELCFYGWIRGNVPPWYGDKGQTSVWEIGREGEGLHPTQKPIELFIRPMMNHSKEGEIVYEPFAGSGSQFVAGQNIGRRVYGLELAPRYSAVVLERMSNAFPALDIRRDGARLVNAKGRN